MTDASRAAKLDSFQDGHVAANAYVLILGGHESTASALALTSYLLALHPEVQERLAEEIDNYRQEHPVRYIEIVYIMHIHVCTYSEIHYYKMNIVGFHFYLKRIRRAMSFPCYAFLREYIACSLVYIY